MKPVPVLMYHHINPHRGDMVTVRPEVFEDQMEYLQKAGYKTLKVDELISYIKGELKLNQKAVVITFDDGWLDNYIYAFPVLKKYGINATIFVITDRIERASERSTQLPTMVPSHNESKLLIERNEEYRVVLNWDLIREMTDSGIIEAYSHTKSHARCNLIERNKVLEELSGSKEIIEKRLGKTCSYLCWPYGKYNETAIQIAKDIGYRAIFTTKHGVVKRGSDPFEIKRIVVKDSVAWFKKSMLLYTHSILSELYLLVKKK